MLWMYQVPSETLKAQLFALNPQQLEQTQLIHLPSNAPPPATPD